jgi:hypothetical protein
MEEVQFDLVKFINDGFDAQQKYSEKAGEFGPRQYQILEQDPAESLSVLRREMLPKRYAKVIEMMSHMIEEIVEARVYVPRRFWKNGERSYLDSPEMRREFIAEMYDVLLFHRATLAYAGVTGEEFSKIAAEKQAYNQVRPDHAVNGNVPVADSPADELQGNCSSSSF